MPPLFLLVHMGVMKFVLPDNLEERIRAIPGKKGKLSDFAILVFNDYFARIDAQEAETDRLKNLSLK